MQMFLRLRYDLSCYLMTLYIAFSQKCPNFLTSFSYNHLAVWKIFNHIIFAVILYICAQIDKFQNNINYNCKRLYLSHTDMSGIHRSIPIPNLGLPVTTTGGSSVVAAFCLKG
jgi:hypothetical protein